MYKVEKGIGIPSKRSGRTLPALKVGESFAVPIGDRPSRQVQTNVLVSMKRRYPSARYVTRTMGDVVRIWRVE